MMEVAIQRFLLILAYIKNSIADVESKMIFIHIENV